MKMLFSAFLVTLCLFLAGCGSPSTPVRPQVAPSAAATRAAIPTPTSQTSSTSSFAITSPDFAQGASIPKKYTCQGDDSSPALAWSAPPAGTKSLALILDDPDAPGGTWVHWVVYNLPPDSSGLPEGASKAKAQANNLPAGSIQGKTSFNRADYGGPCPPSGQHHYIFHLYAADTQFDNPAFDKAGLLKALEGHILASAELTGVYQK